jgi:hypothetical protein
MGNTGNVYGKGGTHLHFGLYYDRNGDGLWKEDEVVDPYGWHPVDDPNKPDPWPNPSQCVWKVPLDLAAPADTSGGSVTDPTGDATVTVPPGAVDTSVTLELIDAPPVAAPSAQLRSTVVSFWFRVLEWLLGDGENAARVAATSEFAQPVSVAISYADAELMHLDESQLAIHWWNEDASRWDALDTVLDLGQNVAVAETTKTGNFTLQAALVCPPDQGEPNDERYAAEWISLDSTHQSGRFDVEGDEDWFAVSAVIGAEYSFETGNLAAGVDTVVEVYGRDGTTLLVADDNGGGGAASYLEWQAPENGTYFVRVRPALGSVYGCDATYDLDVGSSYGLALTPTWSLISWPLEPLPEAEEALDEIEDQEGGVPEIYRWVSESDTWEGHGQDRPFNDFALELGQGYFLKAGTESTWTCAGLPPGEPVLVDLHPIWTLMGLPRLPGQPTAEDLLQEATGQGGECTEVHRWEDGAWLGHVRGEPFNDFALRENNEGYFVKCANAIKYVPGVGGDDTGPAARLAQATAVVMQAEVEPAIYDVLLTNRRDVALSITWRTDQPSTGWVEYGETTALGQTAHDDQGEGAVSQAHHVTLTGLRPETTYFFRVHSGDGSTALTTGTVDDNGGALYQVNTKETGMPPVPYLAYGQVETADGQPAVGALVRAWLVDGEGNYSEPLSAVVDGWGYWNLNLPVDDCEGKQLRLEVSGQSHGEAELAQAACDVQPVPTVVLAGEGPPPGEYGSEAYLPLIRRGR